jgi:hypothetical protein
MAISGVACQQSGQPAAIFHPIGYPTPYRHDPMPYGHDFMPYGPDPMPYASVIASEFQFSQHLIFSVWFPPTPFKRSEKDLRNNIHERGSLLEKYGERDINRFISKTLYRIQ